MSGNFSKYIQERPIRRPGVVVTWGRYNPPTKGHELVFNEAASLANSLGYDLQIHATQTQANDRNPLPYGLKLEYLRELFPRYRSYIVEDGEGTKTTIQKIFRACELEFNNFVLIVGEDRVEAFTELLTEKMESTFRQVEVWSAGERDADSDDIKGVSSSKLRAMALKSDLNNFMAGLPSGVSRSVASALMEDIKRSATSIQAPKAPVILEKTPEREEFYQAGPKFGDAVSTPNGMGFIQEVGTNYLDVMTESGLKRFWPNQVQIVG